MAFIRINNRKNFLITDIPKYHPQSANYSRYWKIHKKRCIEGFWGIDSASIKVNVDDVIPDDILNKEGSWRFMTGNCYFYANFGRILHQEEDGPKSAPKKVIRPHLRDIEWELYYNWLEARGFSGFSDDEDFSCHRDLIEHKDNPNYKFDKTCYNSKGILKTYVPARIHLRQLHNKPLGLPLYQNMAQDLFWLGPRGMGKSFNVGVGIILYELIFDGAKVYNEESIKNPYKVEIFVGAAIASKSSELLQKTEQAMEKLPGAWAEGTDDYVPSPFYKQMSGSLGPNNMKNPWTHAYEKKIGGMWKTLGSRSNIKHGVYTIENPEAAAGGRYSVAVVEEWGLLPNSLQVHGSNTATMMDFPWKFGSSIWIGTGGNVEKIQEGEIMFRNPKGFEALEFEDEWEGTGKIGWFFPAYYAMNDFKDENGNTDVEAAKAMLEKRREEKRKAKSSSALELEMMNYPIIPSEMFLNAKGAMFPQAELKHHLADVKANPHKYENAHYFGDLVFNNKGELDFVHGNPNQLVKEFPVIDNKNKPGIIEIFEMPQKNAQGSVFSKRYIQGTDTYDDDESTTNSLGSTFIFDLWTNRIVAEYTGRRGTKEFYEITRKLNIFYNATHNYEANKKGLFTYYEQMRSPHLLCDTPESLKDISDITISKIGNKAKGTNVSKSIISYGLRLILDWLLEPAYDSENDEVRNLHKIRSIGLLNELINYNSTGNFDRISALIMVMILKEDMYQFTEKKQVDKVKTLAEDDFFGRNFNPAKTRLSINGNGITTHRTKEREQNRMQFETLIQNNKKNS